MRFSVRVAPVPALLCGLLVGSAACRSAPATPKPATNGVAGPGAEWVRVYSDTAFTVALDTSRVQRTVDHAYLLWFETRWARPHQTQAPSPFNRETIRTILRCAPLAYKTVHVSVSLDDGPVVAEQGGTVADAERREWMVPTPGSAHEHSFVEACATMSSADGLSHLPERAPAVEHAVEEAAAPADPSPHTERWIEANGARLYLLDWGGHGPILLFMPGYGMGAHAFDEIAPAFRDRFHVLAITPRGFPPSSAPDSVYTISQLAADVAAVLDTLGARRAVLVGHSISGAVITRFAEKYPDRLLATVYLDGAFDFGKVYRDAQALPIRHPPPTVDTTTAHYRAWEQRNDPPSPLLDRDYRMWDTPAAERERRLALVSQLATEVRSTPHEFWHVRAPALAICAQSTFDQQFGWLTPDSTRWALAQKVFREGLSDQRRRCKEFEERVPRGESLILESGHLVFVDRRAEVTRAMRRFLTRVLPQGLGAAGHS